MHLWSTRDWTLAQTLHGEGGVLDVAFSADSTRVAACYSSGKAFAVHIGGL